MKKSISDCLNVVAEKIQISPADFDSIDDFIDEVVCFAESDRCWGPLSASHRSAIEKYASDDYVQYHTAE